MALSLETISRAVSPTDPGGDSAWPRTLRLLFARPADADGQDDGAGLYARYADELLAFLSSRVEDPELAADLMQESFLRLLDRDAGKAAGELADDRDFLFRTAVALLDEAKESPVWRSLDDPDLHAYLPSRPVLPPDLEVQNRQTVARMFDQVERLPTRCREVFLLHKFHDLTYPEIASRLRISTSAVEKQLRRAREHFSSLA